MGRSTPGSNAAGGSNTRSEHLMNHPFLHARLKQPRRLLGHNGLAEIRALPLAAPVALKEVELQCVVDSLELIYVDKQHRELLALALSQ